MAHFCHLHFQCRDQEHRSPRFDLDVPRLRCTISPRHHLGSAANHPRSRESPQRRSCFNLARKLRTCLPTYSSMKNWPSTSRGSHIQQKKRETVSEPPTCSAPHITSEMNKQTIASTTPQRASKPFANCHMYHEPAPLNVPHHSFPTQSPIHNTDKTNQPSTHQCTNIQKHFFSYQCTETVAKTQPLVLPLFP
jgi:hypothetical protein